MSDEAGSDAKVVVVPHKDPRWQHIQDLADVPEQTRNEIEHFFRRYKDLEPGKFVNIEGWGDAAEAERIVQDGFARLKDAPRPHLTLRGSAVPPRIRRTARDTPVRPPPHRRVGQKCGSASAQEAAAVGRATWPTRSADLTGTSRTGTPA